VRAEDRLFATLDPTTRRVRLGTREALLTDTVGFIQKLPTDLVAAFRSTLEEVRYADVILHVVDISDPRFMSRMRAVEDVLRELGVSDQPVLGAYNKVDLVDRDELAFRLAEARERTAGVPISALARIGLGALVDRLEPLAAGRTVHVKLLIPYSASALVARFHEVASDRRIRYAEDGVHATGMVPQRELGVFRQYEARLGSRDGRGADSST
jgi:GTP-binding protein HflX